MTSTLVPLSIAQTVELGNNRAAKSRVSHEALFLAHLEPIEATIALICRKNRLSAEDAEEFRSQAFVKLIENDYDVLRRFEQRSSLRTYLAVVLQRVYLDFRNGQWGRWRPSAEARRLGRTAVALECLVVRDSLSVDEAIQVLAVSGGTSESPDELREMAARFPSRLDRRTETEDALDGLPDRGLLPDDQAAARDMSERASRTKETLDRAIATLSTRDQLLIKLCFWDRLTVAEVARMCEWEQKPLYRRLQAALTTLRAYLEAEGLAGEASELLDQLWGDFVESGPPVPPRDLHLIVGRPE